MQVDHDRARLLHRAAHRLRARRQGRGRRLRQGRAGASPARRARATARWWRTRSACSGFAAAYAAISKACPAQMTRPAARPDRSRARAHPGQVGAVRPAAGRSWPTGGAISSGCRAPNSRPSWRRSARQPFRAKQLWHWIYHQGVTDFARMSSIARPLQAEAGRALRDRPPARRPRCRPAPTTRANGCSASATGRRRRRSISPTAREDRGAVCISSPGRLHPVLPLLPHRHADAGAQPGRAGDRRPVHGGARCLWRMAEPEGRDAAPAVHHRADGHGRAAVQLRQRRQGDDDRRWTTRASACRAGASRCPPPAWCR